LTSRIDRYYSKDELAGEIMKKVLLLLLSLALVGCAQVTTPTETETQIESSQSQTEEISADETTDPESSSPQEDIDDTSDLFGAEAEISL